MQDFEKLGAAIGLEQQACIFETMGSLFKELFAVAGRKDHLEPRMKGAEFQGKFGAGQGVGHDHVGEEQIKRLGRFRPGLQRAWTIHGGGDVVAGAGGDDAHRVADRLLIFDQQNSFAATKGRYAGGGKGLGRRWAHAGFGEGGQKHGERGADIDRALDLNPAFVLTDDAIHGGQTEAGALTDILGGEKRLIYMREDRGVHAPAVVGDGKTEEVSAAGIGMPAPVVFGERDSSQANADGARAGDRIAGVDDEIHDNLLEIGGIGENARQIFGAVTLKLDVLGQKAREHVAQVGQRDAEIQRLGAGNLTPAEDKQLPRQGRGALAGGEHLRETGTVLLGQRCIVQGETGVTEDDREEVVEIVRDAGGEFADGLHFLGL